MDPASEPATPPLAPPEADAAEAGEEGTGCDGAVGGVKRSREDEGEAASSPDEEEDLEGFVVHGEASDEEDLGDDAEVTRLAELVDAAQADVDATEEGTLEGLQEKQLQQEADLAEAKAGGAADDAEAHRAALKALKARIAATQLAIEARQDLELLQRQLAKARATAAIGQLVSMQRQLRQALAKTTDRDSREAIAQQLSAVNLEIVQAEGAMIGAPVLSGDDASAADAAASGAGGDAAGPRRSKRACRQTQRWTHPDAEAVEKAWETSEKVDVAQVEADEDLEDVGSYDSDGGPDEDEEDEEWEGSAAGSEGEDEGEGTDSGSESEGGSDEEEDEDEDL